MQIAIIGNDFVNLCNVKKRNQNKIWFVLRKGMYKAVPQEFTRKRMTKYGHVMATDECIIFKEGETMPYHPRDTTSYAFDDLLAEIDSEKLTYKKSHMFGKFFAILGNNSDGVWIFFVLGISLIAIVSGLLLTGGA